MMDTMRESLKPLNSGQNTEAEEPILSSSSEGSPKHIQQENGWTGLLILAATSVTIGSALPAGYSIGVVNTPQHIIKAFCNDTAWKVYQIELTPIELDILWSIVVSAFIVGGVVGSLSGSWLADSIGRKGSTCVSNVLGLAAAVLFILCKELSSIEVLLLGRLIVGISAGLTTAVIPMYLTELSPLRLRGATGVMCPLGITIGVLFSQIMGLETILGTEFTWHYLLALYALLILISLTTLPILPESPKYLAHVKHQEQQAIKELVRLRGRTAEELREEVELLRGREVGEEERESADNSAAVTTLGILRHKRYLLPLVLVCAMQSGQQFSGINAVFYYSVTIFQSAGLSQVAAQYASLGAGCINLLMGIVSIYTVNRYGRRPLALLSCTGVIFSLCLLTLSMSLADSVGWMSYVSMSSVLLFVLLYGLGLGPIPYFIGSELFEVGPRPSAMSWGSMCNWAGNLVVGLTFPSMQSIIGKYSFLIFALVTLLLLLLLWFYLPETKDKDQKEVARLLQNGFVLAGTSDTRQKRRGTPALGQELQDTD